MSLVVIMANPYGLRLLWFPFQALGRNEILRHVTEWQPAALHSPQALVLAVGIITFGAALVVGPRSFSRRDIIVSIPFRHGPVGAAKHRHRTPRRARLVARDRVRQDTGGLVTTGLAVLIALLAVLVTADALTTPDYDFREYPVAAMNTLENQRLLGPRCSPTTPRPATSSSNGGHSSASSSMTWAVVALAGLVVVPVTARGAGDGWIKPGRHRWRLCSVAGGS